jgi:hypothetical protein
VNVSAIKIKIVINIYAKNALKKIKKNVIVNVFVSTFVNIQL